MYPVYPYFSYEEKCEKIPVAFPPQHQTKQPGLEHLMNPRPIFVNENYAGSGKLKGKTAVITGGDSGIGRAVAVYFAKEGANVVIGYTGYEREDAKAVEAYIKDSQGSVLLVEGDMRDPAVSRQLVQGAMEGFGAIDILVNNCGVQYPQDSILDISTEQLIFTYEVNVFSYFYLIKEALPHMKQGGSIINTTSIVAYQGDKQLIDYASTKGAIVSLTRSLALSLVEQGIRVNAVAPGYFWTPLQPASWQGEEVTTFGTKAPMGRAGQPFEIAPAYVYLASEDSGYVTGEVMHVNGGAYISS